MVLGALIQPLGVGCLKPGFLGEEPGVGAIPEIEVTCVSLGYEEEEARWKERGGLWQ
jgi:hypothetical protein